jgi:hypothetical protein
MGINTTICNCSNILYLNIKIILRHFNFQCVSDNQQYDDNFSSNCLHCLDTKYPCQYVLLVLEEECGQVLNCHNLSEVKDVLAKVFKRLLPRKEVRQKNTTELRNNEVKKLSAMDCATNLDTDKAVKKERLKAVHPIMLKKKMSGQGQMFPCLQCNFKSSRPSHLKSHLMNKHAFKKATETDEVLVQQLDDVREKKARYDCDQCDHFVTKKMSLKLHGMKVCVSHVIIVITKPLRSRGLKVT